MNALTYLCVNIFIATQGFPNNYICSYTIINPEILRSDHNNTLYFSIQFSHFAKAFSTFIPKKFNCGKLQPCRQPGG